MPGEKTGCNYLAHALSIVVVGASGDLAKKKVSVLTGAVVPGMYYKVVSIV